MSKTPDSQTVAMVLGLALLPACYEGGSAETIGFGQSAGDGGSEAGEAPASETAGSSASGQGSTSDPSLPTGGVTASDDGSGGPGETGSDDGGSTGSEASAYDENLAKILASTFRNTEEDASPHLQTPSVDLYDEPDLYGPVSAYKTIVGGYNEEVYYEHDYFPGNGAGAFRSQCEVSHFAYDDPIIYPGMPEASPLMMFIGNTHANAYSDYDTIMNSGGSTCNGGELNRTAYWVPAIFDGNGNVVVPSKMKFYYKTEQPGGIGNVALYPDNLQLIADRSNNVDGNGSLATFRCNNIYNGGPTKHIGSNTIPTCDNADGSNAGVLELQVFFDHCWNGETETAGDWWQNQQVNFVAPSNYWHSSVCPASHPILLPALVTHIAFDILPGEDTSGWYMSTDVDAVSRQVESTPGTGAMAGWFGGWNKEVNEEFNEHCNNTFASCASGMLADRDDARALRLRNDWITGWASEHQRIPLEDIYNQLCTAADEQPFDAAAGGSMAAHCRPEAAPTSP